MYTALRNAKPEKTAGRNVHFLSILKLLGSAGEMWGGATCSI